MCTIFITNARFFCKYFLCLYFAVIEIFDFAAGFKIYPPVLTAELDLFQVLV